MANNCDHAKWATMSYDISPGTSNQITKYSSRYEHEYLSQSGKATTPTDIIGAKAETCTQIWTRPSESAEDI
eukprot:6725785-Pyramimonas_sp.AAC.1